MKLFTKAQYEALLHNGKLTMNGVHDPKSVVKLFTPDAQATWLLSEIIPDEPDVAFGLCDLGLGSPELGYVSLIELEAVRGKLGLHVERDLHWKAEKTISEYADDARAHGRIRA